MTRYRSAVLRSRNFEMSGRRTSARLELSLWAAYDDISEAIGINRAMLARMIDARRARGIGLTSALRIFLLSYYRSAAQGDTGSHGDQGLRHLISALDTVGPQRVIDSTALRLSKDDDWTPAG